jgi:hypothetical protein
MMGVTSRAASSLKQQSGGRHVAPLGHIILIPSQQISALVACLLNKIKWSNFQVKNHIYIYEEIDDS